MKNSLFNKEDNYSSDEEEQTDEGTEKNEDAPSGDEELDSDHYSEDSELSENGNETATDGEAEVDAEDDIDVDDFTDAREDSDEEENDVEETDNEDNADEKLLEEDKVDTKVGKLQNLKGEKNKVSVTSKEKKPEKMKSVEFIQAKRLAGGGYPPDYQRRINASSEPEKASTSKSTSALTIVLPKKKRPSTQVMVDEAIKSLNERTGSSVIAIRKYIMHNHPHLDGPRTMLFIKKYIKKSLSKGKLQLVKGVGLEGSFKLSAESRRKEEQQQKLKQKRINEKARKQKIKEVAAIKKSPTAKKGKSKTNKKVTKPKKSKVLLESNKSPTTGESKTEVPTASTKVKLKNTATPTVSPNGAAKKLVKSAPSKMRTIGGKENTLRGAKSASAIEKKKTTAGSTRATMQNDKKPLSISVTTLSMKPTRSKLIKPKTAAETAKAQAGTVAAEATKLPVIKSKKSPLIGGGGDGGAAYATRNGNKGRDK